MTAALACVTVAHTVAYVIRNRNPELAHVLAPYDGRITERLAGKMSGAQASLTERSRADELARDALRTNATAVIAASTLGINAQIRGQSQAARRLFSYAEMLSRRDLQTQLWGIEDAVTRNDIPAALRHYDIALRTTSGASDILYPVLASASTDPSVASGLIRVLAAKPAWGDSFVDYVAISGPDPRATVRLFLGLRRAGLTIPDHADYALLQSLVSRNFVGIAWQYYAAIRPGADARMSRDPQFKESSELPLPFDWAPINDAGIGATIQQGERGGMVEFEAPTSVGGIVLQQMQVLPVGEYQIEGRSIAVDQPAISAPYWSLRCLDGRELGRVVVPNSAEHRGRFSGRFSVPADCPAQMLVLVARASDAIGGVSGQIDYLQLRPLR